MYDQEDTANVEKRANHQSVKSPPGLYVKRGVRFSLHSTYTLGLNNLKKTEYTVLFFRIRSNVYDSFLTCWYFPIQLDRSYTCMIENSCMTTFPRWLPSELTCLVRDFVISQFNMQIYCLTSNPEDDFPEKVKQCGSVALSNISLFEHPNQPNTATLFVPLVVQKLHTSPLKIIHNIQ